MSDFTDILARVDPEGKLQKVREYMKHRGEVFATPYGSMVQTECGDAALAELLEALKSEQFKHDLDHKLADQWQARAEQAESALDRDGHKQPCYYCDEPCDGLNANPSRWPIPLCHSDEPGVVRWHHIRCVSERLAENERLTKERDRMHTLMWRIARRYGPPDKTASRVIQEELEHGIPPDWWEGKRP